MLFPSTGLTCGTFPSNEATLTSGTRITVPERMAGSIAETSLETATTDAYSVPCAPDTSARTGPGFVPRITATSIRVAASTPAGTSMAPYTRLPATAVAVPTEMGLLSGTAESPIAATASPRIGPTHLDFMRELRFFARIQARRRPRGRRGLFERRESELLLAGLHAAGDGVRPLPLVAETARPDEGSRRPRALVIRLV